MRSEITHPARAAVFRAIMLGSCVFPTALLAAEQQPGGNTLEEIVVTAQKREESLQKVPIAVSAFSSEALKERSVQTIADLRSAAPNVSFNSTAQGSSTTTVGIRGLKNPNIELSNEQPVATYLDGVFLPSVHGSTAMLGPDITRIEILRGPQGTLYGRNSVGGAMNVITQAPTYKYEGRVFAGVGNHERKEGSIMMNVPLVADKLAVRLNLGIYDDDGYSTNLTTGDPLGDMNTKYARAQVRWNPTEKFEVILRGHYLNTKTHGNVIQGAFLTNPTFRAPLTPNTNPALTFTVGAIQNGLVPIPANFAAVQSIYFSCGGGLEPNLRPKCYGGENPVTASYKEFHTSLTATYDITDNLTFKSVSGWMQFRQVSGQDYDASPFTSLWNQALPHGTSYTQEFQLNGNMFDSRLKFVTGLFLYKFLNNDQAQNDTLRTLTAPNNRNFLFSKHNDRSVAPYAQATYSVTESLRITGGIRYTKEKKSANTQQYQSRAAGTPFACTLPFPNAQCRAITKSSYSAVDYTIGADYDVAPDAMIYVRVAKGFQAGGINQRSTVGVPFLAFDPQKALNYEAGVKADFFNRRARLNASIFQTDVTDAQRGVPATFIVNGSPVSVVQTINAADARIRGVEAELTVVPFTNAQVIATVGYVDPKYKEFRAASPLGPNTLDLSDTSFTQTPKWTVGVSPSYTLPVSYGTYRFQVDYYYQSKIDLAPVLSYPPFVPGDKHTQGDYQLVNGRASLRFNNDRTEVAIWGKNLLDKRYFDSALDLAGSLGFTNMKVANPRTFGVQVTQEF